MYILYTYIHIHVYRDSEESLYWGGLDKRCTDGCVLVLTQYGDLCLH